MSWEWDSFLETCLQWCADYGVLDYILFFLARTARTKWKKKISSLS